MNCYKDSMGTVLGVDGWVVQAQDFHSVPPFISSVKSEKQQGVVLTY